MSTQDENSKIIGSNSLISEVFARFRRYGILTTIKKAIEYVLYTDDSFDRINHTDTGKKEPLWRLRISSSNKQFAVRYDPIDESDLIAALHYLRVDPTNFVFVDLGCGKGRALLVADKYGFRRVIGVEFAHKLVEIAQRNICLTNSKNITVIEGDAAEFPFQASHMVLFMFNPFTTPVMKKVLENLRNASLSQFYVVYVNPACFQLLDDCGFLTRIATLPGRWPVMIWELNAG
jgi:SAM-dependent methyltransferase